MRIRNLKATALGVVRRGPREVAWTPDFMGLGNVLYLLHWADERRRVGHDTWVLVSPKLRPWLAEFPALAALSIERADVRFSDLRLMPWSAARREQPDADNPAAAAIDAEGIEAFIATYLRGAPRLGDGADDAGQVLVNVRRGDYYSVPEIRGQYGFDQEPYLRAAVAATLTRGVPERFFVVSDGIEWCQARLGWLREIAPTEFQAGGDPVADFFAVANARRLIVTNSTFSFWGAYLSTALHGDNHADVVAPRFFDRTQNDGKSWLLDPRWTVVEDIPGGWDS